MKQQLLPILAFLLAFCGVHAQSTGARDTRAKLKTEGYVKSFYISESGNIYLYTQSYAGKTKNYLYKADFASRNWSVMNLDFLPDCYISDDVICESGGAMFLGAASYDSNPVFFRSENGGAFKNIGPKSGGCIYEMWANGNYVAAVSGFTELFFSKDAGLTWKTSHFSDNKKDWRCGGCHYQNDLFFDADGRNGWICEDRNRLYYTPDGGKTFRRFTTPVDQLKIKLIDESLYRFRHIGNHYFIDQGRSVYSSSSDAVNWQKVDSLTWFDRTADGGLIAITTSKNIVAFDAELHLLWRQSFIPGKSCVCQNKLCVLAPNNDIYVVGKDGVACVPMFTDHNISYSEEELKDIVHTSEGHDYMVSNNEITCRDTLSGPWYRVVTHPYKFSSYWVNDSILYVVDEAGAKFKVDYTTQSLVPYNPDLTDLKNIDIVGLAFIKHEIGYPTGCHGPYVNYTAVAPYRLEGDNYVRASENVFADFFKKYPQLDVARDTVLLKDMPLSFSKNDVEELKSLVLNAMVGGRDSFSFTVSASDKKSFKKEMKEAYFYSKREIELCTSYMDTANIERISSELLHKIFSSRTYGFRGSSESRWVVIKLSNGESLFLLNGAAWPNYMGVPYSAYYKEEPFGVNNVNVGIKLNDMTNGVFVPRNKKTFAMYKIAKYMVENQ